MSGPARRVNDTIFADSLADAFAEASIVFPNLAFEPGKMFRFSTNGDPRDKAGWCRVFPDGAGAAFGCHRASSTFIWQSQKQAGPQQSKEVNKARLSDASKERQFAAAARDAQYVRAAKTAAQRFAEAGELDPKNQYVVGHRIVPYKARQSPDGNILLPIYSREGAIQSLQMIRPDGAKRFQYEGKMVGGRLILGALVDGELILFAEGWATGCSLYEATGAAVVICFSGANMAAVAADVRRQFPNSPFVIAGDRDAHGKGLEYAHAAANASAPAVVRLPKFADGRDRGDFNDLHQAEELEEVRLQVVAAGTAPAAEGPPMGVAFYTPQLPVCDARDGTEDSRPLTEFGNAQRMFDHHADRVRYVPDAQRWLCWDGTAWTWDGGSALRLMAATLPQAIYAEGTAHLADGEHFAKWARKSQEHRIINAAVALLSDFEQLRLPLTSVDANPIVIGINQARQVIELDKGMLRATKQVDYVTKTLGVDGMGNAHEACRWHQFLEQVFQCDTELIDWIHRFCGYLMTGSTQEQIFLFLFGHGANGKSVFMEVLKYIMGDYSRAIASETLSESRRQAGAASPDLADLIGARLVVCSETEDNTAIAESLVKSLVSGDTIAVRRLYSAPVQLTPAFKLIIAGNHKPVVRGNDHGIWRRVRLVPFNRKFGPEERDPRLLEKLKMEAPHILAWMVEGCIKWQQRGLVDTPAAIRDATDAYQVEQDVIGAWMAESTMRTPLVETSASNLYANYRTWCLDNGVRPASAVALGRRLRERGYKDRKSHGTRLWCDIKLLDGGCRSELPSDYARASRGY